MSNQSQPKPKKPQTKSKRININYKGQWRQILKEVDKEKVPLNLLDCMVLKLIDGTKVTISVKKLIDNNVDIDAIEEKITEKLSALDHMITDIDFFISIERVNQVVKPITDEILKDL